MDQRLAKRHKRHVSRARAQVKTSEPDLRTEEQIQAAREASGAAAAMNHQAKSAGPVASFRSTRQAGSGSAAKTDA